MVRWDCGSHRPAGGSAPWSNEPTSGSSIPELQKLSERDNFTCSVTLHLDFLGSWFKDFTTLQGGSESPVHVPPSPCLPAPASARAREAKRPHVNPSYLTLL
jgi:hypothetical protein